MATGRYNVEINTPTVELNIHTTRGHVGGKVAITGTKGDPGPKGDKGDKGDSGKSAYEIALDNGFVGTEEEWLESLKVSSESYNSIYEFPNVGNKDVFYIDVSDNRIYRWDETDFKYFCIGADWNNIKSIEGGNANG